LNKLTVLKNSTFKINLNKITDLKNAPKGRVQKIQHYKGRVKRKKLQGEKTKLAHVTVISTYLPIKRIK
jgi:hypothetical protein